MKFKLSDEKELLLIDSSVVDNIIVVPITLIDETAFDFLNYFDEVKARINKYASAMQSTPNRAVILQIMQESLSKYLFI
jgi:hypothetical protein